MPTSQRSSGQLSPGSGWRSRRPSAGYAVSHWRPPEGLVLATAAVGLIYTAHILYGALGSDVAMAMGFATALILGFCLFDPWLRQDLLRLKGLALPALAMAASVAAALLALTPWGPGGAHPVWDYVGAPARSVTLDRSTSLVEIVKLLGLSCMFLVGAAAGSSDALARTALDLIVGFGALFGLWFFFAFVSGSIYQTQARRLEAHFLNPNTAGTVFGVLLTLTAGLLARRVRAAARDRRLWASLPFACAGLIFLACLVATASRAAFAATLLALLLLAAVQVVSGRWRLRAAAFGALAALALGALGLAIAGGVLADRLVGTGEAALSRAYVWKVHWEAFLAAPLSGYGPGTFETVNKTLMSGANFRELWNIRAAMNVYLQWLEQGGLIGAAPMFLCIGLIIVATFRGAMGRSRMTGPLFALLAADLLVLIHGATDFALETPSVSTFWAFLLGLQFALAQGSGAR
jgi:O-antigen ligase